MRTAITALFLFLFVITLLMAAYSVNIPLVSVDPVAAKPQMIYVLGKSTWAEVRSVGLTLNLGGDVTGTEVRFYVRTPGNYIIAVSLLDQGGSVISTGTDCSYYGSGFRNAFISFSPVSIDDVYSVKVEIRRVSICV